MLAVNGQPRRVVSPGAVRVPVGRVVRAGDGRVDGDDGAVLLEVRHQQHAAPQSDGHRLRSLEHGPSRIRLELPHKAHHLVYHVLDGDLPVGPSRDWRSPDSGTGRPLKVAASVREGRQPPDWKPMLPMRSS